MQILKYNISHPYFWAGIFLLFTVLCYFQGKRSRANISLFLSILFVLLCTPIISFWGLESLKYISPASDWQCNDDVAKAAILLPGGARFSGGEIKLNNWSVKRADLVFRVNENNSVTKVIIPGGHLSEGVLLKSYLNEKLEIDIHVGEGSSNTAGNFKELGDVLVRGQYYWLVTSYWHYFRSYLVASKQGIKVCPLLTQSTKPNNWLYHKDAHWSGKAFVHEYMGIVYYWILGEI